VTNVGGGVAARLQAVAPNFDTEETPIGRDEVKRKPGWARLGV